MHILSSCMFTYHSSLLRYQDIRLYHPVYYTDLDQLQHIHPLDTRREHRFEAHAASSPNVPKIHEVDDVSHLMHRVHSKNDRGHGDDESDHGRHDDDDDDDDDVLPNDDRSFQHHLLLLPIQKQLQVPRVHECHVYDRVRNIAILVLQMLERHMQIPIVVLY